MGGLLCQRLSPPSSPTDQFSLYSSGDNYFGDYTRGIVATGGWAQASLPPWALPPCIPISKRGGRVGRTLATVPGRQWQQGALALVCRLSVSTFPSLFPCFEYGGRGQTELEAPCPCRCGLRTLETTPGGVVAATARAPTQSAELCRPRSEEQWPIGWPSARFDPSHSPSHFINFIKKNQKM
ncbi:hypothetical protein CRG98_008064 [Punica granatum]|uniref:Uncharacterized protein n=1 Tax=Punica granatum TaxID=22663 RepID=A0A2I0KSU8_PUNGR|nr:hypothetical protein CRG98_008064 [Punica granatum]